MSKFCEHNHLRLQTSQHLERPYFNEKNIHRPIVIIWPYKYFPYLMSLEVQMLHILIPITIASRLIPLFCLLCLSHSGKPCFLQPAYLLVTSVSWPYHLSIWALGGGNVQEIYFWVLDARGLEAASGPWGGLVGGGGVGKDPAPGWTTILLSVSRERGCQPQHTTAPVEAEQARAEAKKGATEANWGEAAGKGLEAGMGGLWRGGPRWWQELAVPILCQEQVRTLGPSLLHGVQTCVMDCHSGGGGWIKALQAHKYTHTGAKTTCSTTCQLQAPSNCFTFKIKGNIAMIALCVF